MDAALEKRQVKRAYKLYAPAYDFVFDWIFHPGREAAIRLLDIKAGDNVLEVGIGTGLNLPLYPSNCRLTGIDLSEEMLEKAQDKMVELGLGNVTLKTMDATIMDFGQAEFDRVTKTAAPKPAAAPAPVAPAQAAPSGLLPTPEPAGAELYRVKRELFLLTAPGRGAGSIAMEQFRAKKAELEKRIAELGGA